MNILLLSIDCLRYDSLGVFGNKNNLTPFLNSISERCIIFTQAHSTGPYTQASFPSILTSSYYLDFGRTPYLSTQRTLISEVLQKNGIVTAAFHSNPYLSEFFGWNRGWDEFYDSMNEEVSEKQPFISGHIINMKIRNWLKTKKEGPFLLWVHYMDVHEPYIPNREYSNSVYPELSMSEDEMLILFKEVLLKRNVSDKDKVLLLKKLYDAKVREVDDYVKELFAILEEFSLLKDTLIIILSDHGDEFGEHGGLSHDGKMYEELIHVPLLIYSPLRKGKEIFNKFVSTINIPPTILYLFGLKPCENFQGKSLFPLENYTESVCFAEAVEKYGTKIKETDKEIYCLISNGLKIVYHVKDESWEMYDLYEDPQEKNNISQTSHEFGKMKKLLIPRIKRTF